MVFIIPEMSSQCPGTITHQKGFQFFTFIHHCYFCKVCGKTHSTFGGRVMCCGVWTEWADNHKAVIEKINLHLEDDGCPICDAVRDVNYN